MLVVKFATMSEASPRSARTKKKSHLAKLAARRRESDDSASEMGSRASLNDGLRRQVLTRDLNNSSNASDETDEGIGFAGGYSNGQRSKHRLSTEGTLDRFQSMKVRENSMDESDSDGEEAGTSRGSKRDRDQNSDGDDLRKDSGSFRVKKKSISNESDEEDYNARTGGLGHLQSDESPESDSSGEDNKVLGRTLKKDDEQDEIHEQYRNLLNAPDSSENLHRRRSPLSMRKSELDPVEEQETSASEDSPSRKFEPPRPSVASPTPPRQNSIPETSSTSSYQIFSKHRPFSAAMTEMSDKSFQSSSALPLITTKEARNR